MQVVQVVTHERTSQQAVHSSLTGQKEGLAEQPNWLLPLVHMYGVLITHRFIEWHISAEHLALHSKRGMLLHAAALQHSLQTVSLLQARGEPEQPPCDMPARHA